MASFATQASSETTAPSAQGGGARVTKAAHGKGSRRAPRRNDARGPVSQADNPAEAIMKVFLSAARAAVCAARALKSWKVVRPPPDRQNAKPNFVAAGCGPAVSKPEVSSPLSKSKRRRIRRQLARAASRDRAATSAKGDAAGAADGGARRAEAARRPAQNIGERPHRGAAPAREAPPSTPAVVAPGCLGFCLGLCLGVAAGMPTASGGDGQVDMEMETRPASPPIRAPTALNPSAAPFVGPSGVFTFGAPSRPIEVSFSGQHFGGLAAHPARS